MSLATGTRPGEEGPQMGPHGHHTWPLSLVSRRDRCPQEPAGGLTDTHQPRAGLGQQRGRGAQLQGGLQHPGRGALPRSPGATGHRSHHPGHPCRYACTHMPFLPLLLLFASNGERKSALMLGCPHAGTHLRLFWGLLVTKEKVLLGMKLIVPSVVLDLGVVYP